MLKFKVSYPTYMISWYMSTIAKGHSKTIFVFETPTQIILLVIYLLKDTNKPTIYIPILCVKTLTELPAWLDTKMTSRCKYNCWEGFRELTATQFTFNFKQLHAVDEGVKTLTEFPTSIDLTQKWPFDMNTNGIIVNLISNMNFPHICLHFGR